MELLAIIGAVVAVDLLAVRLAPRDRLWTEGHDAALEAARAGDLASYRVRMRILQDDIRRMGF